MNTYYKSGLSLGTILGIILIILKVMGYITWSWWLVLLPFYFSYLVAGILILLGVGVATGTSLFNRTK